MSSEERESSPHRTATELPQTALPPLVTEDAFPRTKTIAFNDNDDETRLGQRSALVNAREAHAGSASHGIGTGYMPRTGTIRHVAGGHGLERTATGRRSMAGRTLNPTSTMNSGLPRSYTLSRQERIMDRGYGGFPTPVELFRRALKYFFPKVHGRLARTMSVPRTNTLTSARGGGTIGGLSGTGVKEVPYITFDALIGRNSKFHDLTSEQHDELGGVEYRALKSLFWIVLIYWVGTQFAGFIIMGPYISAGGRYDDVFTSQFRVVPIYWFAAFQSVSAFSNTGMSLVDQSMLPFQTAYVMIFTMMFLIFAGNTAFPIFLRLSIWLLHKTVPNQSRYKENLQFLLDHPRRCFIYLFPSTQTWFLVFVMFALTMFDWVSFLVLDIGNPVIEAIPVGTRIAGAFLQSAAVRAAGFAIVPLNSLAPAVKVLYVIMMYIAVYPIAMSVRSTNVYEERSLGVFEVEDEVEPEEAAGAQAVAKYLGWHARRQLAFDIWWLAAGLWLVCIIERGNLTNDAYESWFSIFSVLFELVSAYATVGLSLGVPYDNFSLSGSFRKLSKLVVILVMIRGRHRGLPVAIDRAVMLPRDFTVAEVQAFDDERSARRSSRQGSMSTSGLGRGVSRNRGASFPPPSARHQQNRSSEWSDLQAGEPIARTNSPDPMDDSGISAGGKLGRSPELDSSSPPTSPLYGQGFPRSLSTVRESGLSRMPSQNENTEEAERDGDRTG